MPNRIGGVCDLVESRASGGSTGDVDGKTQGANGVGPARNRTWTQTDAFSLDG